MISPATGAVVCVGEALLHLVADGTLAEADALRLEAGGAAVEVAAELARAGVPSRVSAFVGDDALGERLALELTRLGVDASGLVRIAGKKTGLLVFGRGADRRVSPYRDLELEVDLDPGCVEDARHLHFASVLPSSAHVELLAREAHRARTLGLGTSLDLNARPRFFPTPVGLGYQAALARLAPELDWLKASDEDLERLGLDERTIRGWLRDDAWLFVTLAERGLRATGPTLELELAPPRRVARGMGAGDAFVASLIRQLDGGTPDGADLRAILERAQSAAIERLERGTLGGERQPPS